MTVFYMFVRAKFDWSIQQSTFYDSANIIVMILGNIVGMYILNKVRLFRCETHKSDNCFCSDVTA